MCLCRGTSWFVVSYCRLIYSQILTQIICVFVINKRIMCFAWVSPVTLPRAAFLTSPSPHLSAWRQRTKAIDSGLSNPRSRSSLWPRRILVYFMYNKPLPKSHIFISPKRFHCKYGVPRHTQCAANKYPAPTFEAIAHPGVRQQTKHA